MSDGRWLMSVENVRRYRMQVGGGGGGISSPTLFHPLLELAKVQLAVFDEQTMFFFVWNR